MCDAHCRSRSHAHQGNHHHHSLPEQNTRDRKLPGDGVDLPGSERHATYCVFLSMNTSICDSTLRSQFHSFRTGFRRSNNEWQKEAADFSIVCCHFQMNFEGFRIGKNGASSALRAPKTYSSFRLPISTMYCDYRGIDVFLFFSRVGR